MIEADDVRVMLDGSQSQLLLEFACICASLIDNGVRANTLHEGVDLALQEVESVHRKHNIVNNKELNDFMDEVNKRVGNAKKNKSTTNTRKS